MKTLCDDQDLTPFETISAMLFFGIRTGRICISTAAEDYFNHSCQERDTHLAHRHYVNVDHGVDELKHREDDEASAHLTLEVCVSIQTQHP